MIEDADLELFARSLEHATATHTGAALDAALEDLGWHEALSADPRHAVSLLFAAQGTRNATSSALDALLAGALDRVGSAVVLPTVGQWTPPGNLWREQLNVRGIGTASLGEVGKALVVARSGSSYSAFEVEAASLQRRPIVGIDPSLELKELTGEVLEAREIGPVDWRAAVALGQLALGHELVGAARHMLWLARGHALERVQFGRPVAKFQAIRHRLADTLVAIEAAEAMLEGAWLSSTPQAAAMAKATAGRSARVATRHCQQVLAGIGFTTEHPFHRYVRRVLALEQLLGATRALTRDLGSDILERRQLPGLLPL